MLKQSQIDLCGRVDFTREVPLLGRDEAFSFACAGCGNCCRGREDIVLSGFDLWRIAARLRLPMRTVARAFCKASIGQVSRLPVLRLAPVREEGNNCPFLTEDHCAIHEAEPLVCALYPLEALFEPVFLRRMQQKLWQALYYQYEITQPFLPQLEKNLVWLEAELEKLSALQRRRNARFDESIEKIER